MIKAAFLMPEKQGQNRKFGFGNGSNQGDDMRNARGNEGDAWGDVNHDEMDASRRELLAKLGRFAYAAPALALLAQPKRAAGAYGKGTRPGRGYGDKNHDHTGPPGLNK